MQIVILKKYPNEIKLFVETILTMTKTEFKALEKTLKKSNTEEDFKLLVPLDDIEKISKTQEKILEKVLKSEKSESKKETQKKRDAKLKIDKKKREESQKRKQNKKKDS